MSDDVVIVSAARTPVGSFNGAFATMPAHDLGAIAIKAALERAGIEPGRVSEVIMGQILTAAQGQNPARQASIAAGIPVESPAWGVNQLCGSGLRTVALGYQALLNGDSEIVVAGGQESMSMAPHAQYLRGGVKMGPTRVHRYHDQGRTVGCLQRLPHGQHRRECRQTISDHARSSRTSSPSIRRTRPRPRRRPAGSRTRSFQSRSRPARATSSSMPTNIRVTARRWKRWPSCSPAFEKDGTVTAGSASGINDGAAAVVLMTAKQAAKEGKKAAARIVSWGQAGVDPKIMGTGPIPASRAALKKAGWKHRRPRPDRGQRSLRGAGLRGQQGHRLGYLQGQRQWRRDRDRPSGRRIRRARAGDAAARNAEARRQEGPRHLVHRRRHGHRDVRCTRLIERQRMR